MIYFAVTHKITTKKILINCFKLFLLICFKFLGLNNPQMLNMCSDDFVKSSNTSLPAFNRLGMSHGGSTGGGGGGGGVAQNAHRHSSYPIAPLANGSYANADWTFDAHNPHSAPYNIMPSPASRPRQQHAMSAAASLSASKYSPLLLLTIRFLACDMISIIFIKKRM